MKKHGVTEKRPYLLKDITGAFRPGVLTALMGVSGAGKTTLIDVLAGRKTCGHIEGDIRISGFPKVQETFARILGYCEQNDIHSSQLTVHESLLYSCWLRLAPEIDSKIKKVTYANESLSTILLLLMDTQISSCFSSVSDSSMGYFANIEFSFYSIL